MCLDSTCPRECTYLSTPNTHRNRLNKQRLILVYGNIKCHITTQKSLLLWMQKLLISYSLKSVDTISWRKSSLISSFRSFWSYLSSALCFHIAYSIFSMISPSHRLFLMTILPLSKVFICSRLFRNVLFLLRCN